MRPDEHKKKSSAKYKKKHGIQKTDNVTTQKTDLLQDKGEKAMTNKIADVQEGTSKFNSNVDSLAQEAVGKKSYSKRTLLNNWDKYEEQEKENVQIGADFNELLSAAGGASSHMVLKTEKDWNLDQDMDEVLSIDFQKLADSLSKLPFFERLGLDETQFDPSLVKLLNGSQGSNEVKSKAAPLHSFSFRDYNFDFSNPKNEKDFSSTNDSSLIIANTDAIDSTVLHDDEETSSEPISIAGKQSVDSKLIDDVAAIEENLKNKCEDTSSPSENRNTSPISFSKPVSPKPTSQVASTTAKSIITEDLESELDDLLSGTITISSSQNSEVKKNPKIESGTTAFATKGLQDKSVKEQDDLEDWLDSII